MTNGAPPAETLLNDRYPYYGDRIEHIRRLPTQEADTVPAEEVLPDRIADRLGHDLYTHQAFALNELAAGENISVATSTSSGKTMVYALHLARRYLATDGAANGLFLYPTKALSRDQHTALEELYDRLNLDINVAVYDGDTPSAERRRIREEADGIITNFAGLNYYLPHHHLWNDFYSGVEVVAVDESHSYAGVLGMHVAWIIRRLQRVLNHHEAAPSWTLTSATIGNPKQHAEALINTPVYVINDDGSPRGEREVVYWNPPARTPDDDEVNDEDGDGTVSRKPASAAARDVVAHLATEGVQTLSFVRSRKQSELLAHRVQERLDDDDSPWANDATVSPYHAGHGKESRRNTEHALDTGAIEAVASTSALELGIDIGSVDAVTVVGYPGTRQSFFQQIGRAGRGGTRSLAVLIADHSAVDQYLVNNPDHLFEGDVEDAVVALNNNEVYAAHLLAAANELPLTEADIGLFGEEQRLRGAVEMFNQTGKLANTLEDGAVYDREGRPEADIDIYAAGDERFEVVGEGTTELDMEPIQRGRAYRDFHEGATFLHGGERYLVTDLADRGNYRRIRVRYAPDISYYTRSRSETTIENINTEETRTVNGFQLHSGTGTVSVHHRFYDRVNINSNNPIEQMIPTGLPPIEMDTSLCWVEPPMEVIDTVVNRYPNYDTDDDALGGSPTAGVIGGLHAAEHGMIAIAPLELKLESGDLGGLTVAGHPAVDGPGFIVYDGVEGGLGFADAVYDRFESLAQRTRSLINGCDCTRQRGCPACVMSDRCGDGNSPLHKDAADDILGALVGEVNLAESIAPKTEPTDNGTDNGPAGGRLPSVELSRYSATDSLR